MLQVSVHDGDMELQLQHPLYTFGAAPTGAAVTCVVTFATTCNRKMEVRCWMLQHM